MKVKHELPEKFKSLMGGKDGCSSPDDPQSPPKLFRPFQGVDTFDRNVSNKIHKNLVTTRLHTSKDKPGFQASIPMSESTKVICPLPTNDIIVAAMNAKTDSSSRVATIPAIPLEAHNDATIVSGTREKRRILEAYETKFGTGYPDSIITRKKVSSLIPHYFHHHTQEPGA